MSFDLDDPKLTAYALGELDEAERAAMEAQLADDPVARGAVEQIRQTGEQLRTELAGERLPTSVDPIVLLPRPAMPWRIAVAAVAACLILSLGIWTVTLGLKPARETAMRAVVEPSASMDVRATAQQPAAAQPAVPTPGTQNQTQSTVQRDTMVRDRVREAQHLVKEGKYEQAAAVTSQILTLDPQNEYAQSARPLIEDRARFLDGRLYREDFDRELTRSLNMTEEQRVPYNDILRYPSNWPDLSGRRNATPTAQGPVGGTAHLRDVDPGRQDRSVAFERGDEPSAAVVAAQLEKRLPEVRLENSAFGDVVDFLRDVSGANIYVDWRGLEAVGVTRSTPLTLRMRDAKFSDVVRHVLDSVQQPGVKIHVGVDEGVITLSPREGHGFNTEAYDRIVDNPFLDATQNPLSTFSIDVDTASYSNIRRFLNQGQLPPKDAVRIEEMLNYFTYDYPAPREEGAAPFSSNVEVASCPWNERHRLVRVALKGKEVARDERPESNLVFLIDVSGSMRPENKLPLLKRAMAMLVKQLGETDRVAIVVYAGSSGLVLPSTSCDETGSILNALGQLQSGGSTNGAQGIELAYDIATQNFIKGGVNRVILCTDGDFNVGVTDQGALTRLIEDKAKTGVFLSVLGFGMGNVKDSTMEKLADKGNGNYAYIDTMNEAKKVLVEQMSGTLVTIAKDVKVQVEFNPARVASYRLIGYENRMLAKEDFNDDQKDAGEIGAGHAVTALYEVVPVTEPGKLTAEQRREVAEQKRKQQEEAQRRAAAGADPATQTVDPLKYQKPAELTQAAQGDEIMTLKLRYKEPDGDTSKLLEFPVTDGGATYAKASGDFKFAASVAGFGMILRDSPHKGRVTFDAVMELAEEGRGADANGYRGEFIELVRKAKELKR